MILRPTGTGSAPLRELAAAARTARGPLIVRDPGLVIPEGVLALLEGTDVQTTVLVARSPARPTQVSPTPAPLRVLHHRLHSAGSSAHDVTDPDHVAVGALVVGTADLAAAADAWTTLADVMDAQRWPAPDPVDLATVALVRSGIPTAAVAIPDVPWGRGTLFAATDHGDGERLRQRVAEVDPRRLAGLLANRPDDGLYSTLVLRRLSKPLTATLIRLRVAPNAITLASLAIGLLAAGAFALGRTWSLILGAVLLQMSLVIDCCDGEVARATNRMSPVGAWLDASTDRVKEFAAYAGLATGAAVTGTAALWPLAALLLVIQTFRHMGDYDFSRIQRMREGLVAPVPLDQRGDGHLPTASALLRASGRLRSRPALMWAKRVAHMPIGERWLWLSLAAALGGAAWALGGLLALTLLALVYVTAGRVLRTRTWRGPTAPAGALLLQRQIDSVILGSGVRRHRPLTLLARPVGWVVPPLLRLLEMGLVLVLVLAAAPGAIVVAFVWLFLVAFHHYDGLYRSLQDRGMPGWIIRASAGWEGRSLLVIVLAALGIMAPGLGIAAVPLALVVVVIASVQWLIEVRRPRG